MHAPHEFFALAPTDLPNHRSGRFDGGGFGFELGAFGPADRARLTGLYESVNEVARLPRSAPPEVACGRLLDADVDAMRVAAAMLGQDTPAALADQPRVRQFLHDVRGGGLQVLVGMAELLRDNRSAVEFARNAVSAARDHAKIMRAGLPDLDPERYEHDEADQVHAIDGFVHTWDGLTAQANGRVVTVAVECEYHGAITGRCLETASVDRVLYNYVNNAMRFAADGKVRVCIFRVSPGLVRWVVHNAVTAEDRAWLGWATGGDLRKLFAGGTTNGGNGVGLSGCAEIVGTCFGVGTACALRQGYLGAALLESGYAAWFHWPAHAPTGAACRCGD